MAMHRKARFCTVCGQAFHSHGLWGVCPGCRAEAKAKEREGKVAQGFNLPDNCTAEQVDAAHGEPDRDRVCMWCRHCIEECCDMGLCELRLDGREPEDFKDWSAALDFMDGCRVDMQADTCEKWEEYR